MQPATRPQFGWQLTITDEIVDAASRWFGVELSLLRNESLFEEWAAGNAAQFAVVVWLVCADEAIHHGVTYGEFVCGLAAPGVARQAAVRLWLAITRRFSRPIREMGF